MALGATVAKLLASLDLDTKPFERGIARTNKSLGGLESRFSTVGKVAAVGIGAAAGVGLLALGRGIKGGINSLAELETAVSSVDGAIKQMGLAGQLTGQQVAGWASDIEKAVGSAFDDKAITQAATTLIRFGKITPANLKPALQVMTDLATKTGSVDSAASLLAKALADPEKAAGKLARSGVVLTKQQQAQIKAMVKAGKTADAQAFLLDQLSKATTGAALASQGPYARSLAVLRDVTEDAERALGEGFLPVIEKVRDILTRELAKPQTIQTLRDFGKGLAGGLDKLVDIASGLPWGAIGDAFKLVGQGSKAALDLFTGLPPWVQTAVLTGWGLNKLTGGGLGTIVGELGKGLIKGVLGMNAGVVNINAGVVNGAPGGVPAAAPAGGLGLLGGAFVLTLTAAGEIAIADQIGKAIRGAVEPGNTGPLRENHVIAEIGPVQFGVFKSQAQAAHEAAVAAMRSANATKEIARNTAGSPDDRDEEKRSKDQRAAIDNARDKIESSRIATVSKLQTVKQSTDAVRDRLEAARIAIASATQNSATRVSNTTANAADRIVRAIYATRPQVTVNVSGSPDDRSVTTSGGAVRRTGSGARRR